MSVSCNKLQKIIPLEHPKVQKESLLADVLVKESGCWEYRKNMTSDGYGRVGLEYNPHRRYPAHRVFYSVFVEPIPDGRLVLHTCANRCCVNPAHLKLGDEKQNAIDREKDGHTSRGETHGTARFTLAEIKAIRRFLNSGFSYRQVMRAFGIKSVGHVYDIAKHRVWKGVC